MDVESVEHGKCVDSYIAPDSLHLYGGGSVFVPVFFGGLFSLRLVGMSHPCQLCWRHYEAHLTDVPV